MQKHPGVVYVRILYAFPARFRAFPRTPSPTLCVYIRITYTACHLASLENRTTHRAFRRAEKVENRPAADGYRASREPETFHRSHAVQDETEQKRRGVSVRRIRTGETLSLSLSCFRGGYGAARTREKIVCSQNSRRRRVVLIIKFIKRPGATFRESEG